MLDGDVGLKVLRCRADILGTNRILLPLIAFSFYSAILYSRAGLFQCARVACNSECVTVSFYSAFFPYPPKSDSAVWLLRGWCHVKLLLSQHMFCVHHAPFNSVEFQHPY